MNSSWGAKTLRTGHVITPPHRQQASSSLLLTQTPGLTLGLEERQDVTNADGALDVANDGPVLVVKKVNPHLGDATTAASTAKDHGDLAELDGLLLS